MALFDYDPPTMSPNPEACEEELPFREGQVGWSSVFLSDVMQLRFHIRQDINVRDGLVIIFIKETLSFSLCSLSR